MKKQARLIRTCKLNRTERHFYARLIGELQFFRRRMGISQSTLEQTLGVSEGMVAKWETAARFPGPFNLMCWCQALGLELHVGASVETLQELRQAEAITVQDR